MDQATRRLSPDGPQQFPPEGIPLAPHPGGSRTVLFVKLVFSPTLSPWGMAGVTPAPFGSSLAPGRVLLFILAESLSQLSCPRAPGILAHFSLKRHSFSLWKTGFGNGQVCPAVFKMDNQQGPAISKLPNFSPHSHLLPHSVSSCSSTSFPKLFLNGPLSHCGGRGAFSYGLMFPRTPPIRLQVSGIFLLGVTDTLVENSH